MSGSKFNTGMSMSNICPVCGYPELDKPAYTGTVGRGSASYEICSSCGFQYGWTDDDQHISFEQWRKQWIANGMLWFSKGCSAPAGWSRTAFAKPKHSICDPLLTPLLEGNVLIIVRPAILESARRADLIRSTTSSYSSCVGRFV